MNKKTELTPGDIVEVEFLDHVEDGDAPLTFKVWGKLVLANPEYLVLSSWAYSFDDPHKNPDNEKQWVIVQGAIIKTTKLKHA
jgi:hypothetical protein